ncbi:MAG: hypothetical protein M1275_03725 [Patescibacteria group bacterium]|nr:hypothetical protein [Patescibacteria group bacterium]
MVFIPDQKNLEVSEKIVEAAESLQQVPRYLYVILATVVVLMIPLVVVLRLAFYNLLFANYTPPKIIYVAPVPKDLQVVDKKVFSAGDGAYYAYVRVGNPNSDLGIRVLRYRFVLTGGGDATLGEYAGTSYVLPGQERLLFMPPQKLDGQPIGVKVELLPERWSRIGDIRSLNFIYQQIQFGKDSTGHFYTSAVLDNKNPYIIPEVEMGVLLYNIKHEVIGANSTVLNHLGVDETRFFRVIWPLLVSYQDVANVEFKASVNLLEKDSLLTEEVAPEDVYDNMR